MEIICEDLSEITDMRTPADLRIISRPTKLTIGRWSLPLPIYFPSISSVKTALRPYEYLYLLASASGLNRQFLVSAFDLANVDQLADVDQSQSAQQSLIEARQAGVIRLMNSGNYESFWKGAQANWKQADFHNILAEFPCDLAFGFDVQQPSANMDAHLALIVKHWQADQAAAGSCQIIPIIHATASKLPALCAAVAAETGVTMLAVPEFRLGDGIFERARVVKAIRATLDDLGYYVVLHLLGAGNPISMTMYTVMGADSFNGLEWCQKVVDSDTGLLYPFSQADFFVRKSAWCDGKVLFQARALAHNLEFFSDWMRRLHNAIRQDRLSKFCQSNLPRHIFRHITDAACWSRS